MLDRKATRFDLLALSIAVLVAMIWRVSELALPPHGEHAWRDADGIGIARCLLREGFHLFAPTVVERGSTSGVVGMEFPLVNTLGGALMGGLGVHALWARLPIWLSLIPLALGAFFLGARVLGSVRSAALAASVLVLQPLVVVYARKCMPEIPMLACLVWAVALAYDALHRPSLPRGIISGVLFALAAVLKPTGYAAALPVALWLRKAWIDAPPEKRGALIRAALPIGVLPVVAAAAWFHHARALDAQNGLPLFRLHHDWLDWIHMLPDPRFHAAVFGRLLHTYLLWPTVIWMVWRRQALALTVREQPVVFAWFLAALGAVVLFGSHNLQHPYYAIPLLVPLALLVGAFAERACALHARPARAAALFLLVFAVTAVVRVEQRREPLGFDLVQLKVAQAMLPQRGLAVVTDARTPVVSLVLLDRMGWALPASELTPEKLQALKALGARQLIESQFGGWLPESTRAALGPPVYADSLVRAYDL